jgi:hypothetical protein
MTRESGRPAFAAQAVIDSFGYTFWSTLRMVAAQLLARRVRLRRNFRMASSQLYSADIRRIGRADPAAVALALSKSPLGVAGAQWLGSGNRYGKGQIDQAKAELDAGNHDSGHLSEYLAAAALIHCGDGWSYIGRSLEAGTRGDVNSAVHLAYYASLRAALSILATQGIGVLNNRAFVTEGTGKCIRLDAKLGTHVMAWLALREWARGPKASDLLGDIIRPFGIDLGRWMAALPAAQGTWVSGSLLERWGADLQRAADDQVLRNVASYNPNFIDGALPLPALDACSFVVAWWRLFEPSAPSPFDKLDRHLLRIAIEQALGASPLKGASVQGLMNGTGLAGRAGAIEPFLTRTLDRADPVLFDEARRNPTNGDVAPHFPVVARASLLLRIASGASALLLQRAGVGPAQIEFWWLERLRQRGIWSLGPLTDPGADLWPDIDVAIQSLDQWRTRPLPDASFASFVASLGDAMWVLGGGERISAWGLDL